VNAALNLRVPKVMELVKPTRNIPLGRPRSIWEDNIRMDLKEIDESTKENKKR
jgi:hypothetical protein